MEEKRIYLIAGPNGAGKTTASKSILPDLLNCDNFVNADEIARGLSPFKPEEMAIQAGRIQLQIISELINDRLSFAIETTLATRNYIRLIQKVRRMGYKVTLAFFWLPSADMAKERVEKRVKEGGHNIPVDVIYRRFETGLKYLVEIYQSLVDELLIIDNTVLPGTLVAKRNGEWIIFNQDVYERIFKQ